jgi:hypothetical protein
MYKACRRNQTSEYNGTSKSNEENANSGRIYKIAEAVTRRASFHKRLRDRRKIQSCDRKSRKSANANRLQMLRAMMALIIIITLIIIVRGQRAPRAQKDKRRINSSFFLIPFSFDRFFLRCLRVCVTSTNTRASP